MWLLVRMALTTGARRGELLAIKWENIDWERKVADLGRTKNGEQRGLPLMPDVLDELEKFKKPTGLVFGSQRDAKRPMQFEKCWQDALKEAGIRGFTFHGLRHTCASHLAMSGGSLTEVADLLGHRTLAMTKRYSHLSTEHKHKVAAKAWGMV